MSTHRIIAIGASAGGVEALTQLIRQLPADLPVTLFVAVHFPASSVSVLPNILNRCRSLPAIHPQDGQRIQSNQIYIALPDYHLIVRSGYVHLSRGPCENGHRPAIDTLFRSVAQTYRHQAIGIILSGTLDDGTAGMAVIKVCGGTTIVQDPREALFDGMPRSAMERVEIDHILRLSDIAALLIKLAQTSIEAEEEAFTMPDEMTREADIVAHNKADLEQGAHPGTPSPITCPDCGGVLWELQEGNLIRFRCHVGHAYSSDSLLSAQGEDVERALWSAVRVLEEKAALARRMAHQAKQQDRLMSETQFLKRAEEAARHAGLLRQVILHQTGTQDPNGQHKSAEEIDGT